MHSAQGLPGTDAGTAAQEYAVCWLDLHGRVSRWNAGAQEMFGYRASEATALHFSQLFVPDGPEPVKVDIGLARVRSEGSWDEVGWHIRRDGERFWAASSVTLVRTPNGIEIGCLVVTRRLDPPAPSGPREALTPGAFRLVSVGRVASHLAHEVGNVLTAVRGFAGLLERHLPGGGASHEVWRELVKTCDRGTTFTRTLLGVGQDGDDDSPTVDLADLVRGMEPLLRQVTPERILLVTSVGSGLPRIVGRVGDLELVLLNLVVNARDAIEGEGTIAVTAALAQSADTSVTNRVVLTVRDSGSGVGPEVQERMFDHFFTTKSSSAGTGLGLAFVRDAVRACGGTIAVDSEPGAGTSMSVHFHAAREVASELRPRRPRGGGAGRADVVLVHPGGGSAQDAVADLLRRRGFDVVAVGSAAEARAVIAGHGPSVILVLPDTAPELVDTLRPEGVGPPAILLSGEDPVRQTPVRPGDRVIPGLLSPELLLSEVEQLLADAALGQRAHFH
jgi:PAS domain S-box-containing protein